jgi:hypothetical protein
MEVYRLICIFTIAWWHFRVHGRVPETPRDCRLFKWFRLLEIVRLISVNGMIAISGYFGPTSRGLNLRRLFCLWLTIVFYQVIQTWFICWMQWATYTTDHLIRIFTPLAHTEYWYFTSYFAVMLVSPALNNAARGLSKSAYGAVIFTLFLIELISRRVGGFVGIGPGYEPVHLGIVYFIAGYFRVHGNPFRWRFLAWAWLALSAYAVDYARFNWIGWLFPGRWSSFFHAFAIVPHLHSGVLQLQLSMAMLLCWSMVSLRGGLGAAASFGGAHAFAAYIVHDSALMRPHVFHRLFRVLEWKWPADAATIGRIRFAITILIFGIMTDAYRGALFDRVGKLEMAVRQGIGSGWGAAFRRGLKRK